MTITCPACRKSNDLAPSAGPSPCARCGTDLAMLGEIVADADRHLAVAAAALRRKQWQRAQRHAERSWKLRHQPPSARLAFLAAAALGQTTRAAYWHPRAQCHPDQNG